MGKFENNKMFKITNCLTEPIENVYFLYEHAMQEYIIFRPKLLALSDEMKEIEIESAEKVQANGRYDLVVNYTDADMLMIAELKKREIDIKAYDQLNNYLNAEQSKSEYEKFEYGLLVGSAINPEVIEKIYTSKKKNIYAIVLSRFSQGAQEYVSTTVYKPQDTKDYTKYTLTNLQGDIISKLGKGKLSYEIIKSYIKFKKNCTCENVQETFDNIINKGELKIVRKNDLSEDNIQRIRYFKEPLQCSDCEVIVCNQWGKGNIEKMIKKATEVLGMTIEY